MWLPFLRIYAAHISCIEQLARILLGGNVILAMIFHSFGFTPSVFADFILTHLICHPTLVAPCMVQRSVFEMIDNPQVLFLTNPFPLVREW